MAAITNAEAPQSYSAFTKGQKRFIVAMVTLASFFSPLSGQIYYPVMPTLAHNYHLTNALINLTITTYMVLQGLAPAFLGTFADTCGRRPAYILAFTIYTAANIGLALQNSYAALMVLRCIQSAGSSGTVSFGYGVIADIATPVERGSYIGPMAAGVMLAPALGPVIGGLLAKFLGWRCVFWFLVVVSGGYLVVYVLLVPETARCIVGDGRVLPKEVWRRPGLQLWQERKKEKQTVIHGVGVADGGDAAQNTVNGDSVATVTARASKLRFPNPLMSFAILLEPDALILISSIGLLMLANIALLTSIPSLFSEIYSLNSLQIGLCFLYASCLILGTVHVIVLTSFIAPSASVPLLVHSSTAASSTGTSAVMLHPGTFILTHPSQPRSRISPSSMPAFSPSSRLSY
jgi:multidrug resistance protein